MNSSTDFRAGKRYAMGPQVARAATAAVLASAVAFSLAACSSPASTSSEPSATASPTATAEDLTGTYAKLTLDANSPAYVPNPEQVPHVTAYGWTADNVAAGQRLAVDYVVNEFLDSSALETGDEGYRAWHADEAPKYLSEELHALVADGSGTLVVGNIKGRLMVPELIKDGSPRLKDLNLSVSNVSNTEHGASNRITYTINYSGDYRISDASAAQFMSDYIAKKLPVEKHHTPEQFLASDMARPSMKDGVGENKLHIGGVITVNVLKNAEGTLVIDGFQNKSGLDTADFTWNDEEFFATS
jgi:hypothetical protein